MARKYLIRFAMAALLCSIGTTAQAQGVGGEIWKNLFRPILSAAIGMGFDSMFGANTVTPEIVGEEVHKGIVDLETHDANTSYEDVIKFIKNYHADEPLETRRRKVQDILQGADHVESAMEGLMHERFWQVMKSYTEVKNVEFAFLAESAVVNSSASTLTQLGDEAADTMQMVYHYFEAYFRDTTNRSCIKKSSKQKFFNKDGNPVPDSMTVRGTRYNLKRYYCQDLIKRIMDPRNIFHIKRDMNTMPDLVVTFSGVFKNPRKNEYWFTLPYFKNPHRNPYHLHGPFPTQEKAKAWHIALAGKEYPRDLGRVRRMARSWYEIAQKHGSTSAKQKATEYLAKWNPQ